VFYPFEVLLPASVVGSSYESIVTAQQVRAISKLRLLERIGTVEDEESRLTIENRLLEHLGIEFEAEL
jgi:mRNA-degrading endonuclease toxin of MazEF toxin-antitoxin module